MSNDYNGWANWETWNVALWIQNDETLYATAKHFRNAECPFWTLAECLKMAGITETPDGAKYNDFNLDVISLNEMMRDL